MAKKQLVNIMTNPMAGLIGAVIQRSPVGMVYGAANVATKAATGKTIPQHVVSSATKAATNPVPTKPRNVVGDAVRQEKMMRGIAPQTREAASKVNPTFARGDFDRSGNSKGGRVSYKSVFDMER